MTELIQESRILPALWSNNTSFCRRIDTKMVSSFEIGHINDAKDSCTSEFRVQRGTCLLMRYARNARTLCTNGCERWCLSNIWSCDITWRVREKGDPLKKRVSYTPRSEKIRIGVYFGLDSLVLNLHERWRMFKITPNFREKSRLLKW